MPTLTRAELMELLAPELLAMQRETEKKIAAITAERDRILSRMKEAAKQAANEADNERPVVPYMFPQAICSHCGKSFLKNRKGKRPLSINEMKWVKPRNNLTSGILCPDCKLKVLGKREKYSIAPTPEEIEFERNPTVWPFIKAISERPTGPVVDADLHTAQAGSDAVTKRNRLEIRRLQQAAQQERLMRRELQNIELLKWVAKEHSLDLVEGARVTILDGTDAGQAERDRRAVIRMAYDDLGLAKHKIPFPLRHRIKDAYGRTRLVVAGETKPKTCVHGVALDKLCSACRIIRRHGKQHTWLKAEPGTSESGPKDPNVRMGMADGETHSANTVYHVEVIDTKKPKDKGDSVKTFEYTKAPIQATASRVGEAVAKLYQAPAARSLATLQGQEMDLAGSADLPRQVQELLAVQNLTQYANEGCKMYVLSHKDETYTMYVTASVDLQVYAVMFDGVLGWAVYTESEDPAEEFTFAIRHGCEDKAFATVTLKDLAAYPAADRGEYVTLFDIMLYLLNKKGD